MENFNLLQYGILSMEDISPSEKLLMLQLATSKSLGIKRLNVTTSAKQLGYTRNGWQKVAKRLIERGFVNNPKRGYYELANTNIF
jgi:DNA-binding MarR family transcriptional regulator